MIKEDTELVEEILSLNLFSFNLVLFIFVFESQYVGGSRVIFEKYVIADNHQRCFYSKNLSTHKLMEHVVIEI